MKKHLSLLFAGFLLGLLVFGFINFDENQSTVQRILSGVLGVFVAYLVFFSNDPLNRWVPWKKYTGLRLLLGIIWNSISAYALILFGVWVFLTTTGGVEPSELLTMEVYLKLGILLFCASVIYNTSYFAFYSYNQYSTAQLRELKTERKQAELQLATLKAQLSPHFLFNCINSLSVLFHTNLEKAEAFIRAMAKSYQYTLDNYRTSLITVEKEMAFVESYAYLLKTRFDNGFQLNIELSEQHLLSKVPPLTLQILVENAVKHNKVSAKDPIIVSISGSDTALKVSNNKRLSKNKKPSTGIGLKNIASRYKILSNAKIGVEDQEKFVVTLPLLHHE